MKKWFSALCLLILVVPGIQAQEAMQEVDVESYIELLRSDLRATKTKIITAAMEFTQQEAEAFWPVYRQYEAELTKIGDARLANIKDYAKHYETMTDDKAKELVEKWFQIQQNRLDLRKKYFQEFSKVLPVTKAAKFMQIEHQIGLLVDLQIASELPLVKAPENAKETTEKE